MPSRKARPAPARTARPAPAELYEFLVPYGPEVTDLFLATRAAVLARAPGANELVYDAYNAVACAYTFSERTKEAFCHVAAYPKHVNLGFNRGASLPDPRGLLAGSGARIRHVRIAQASDLEQTGLAALVQAAVKEGRSLVEAPPTRGRAFVKPTTGAKRRP